jgi:hypothetical protein
MNNGEILVKNLIRNKRKVQELLEEMKTIENALHGMEITYRGKWAMVECVDSNKMEVMLHLKDDMALISINELLSVLSA